MNYTNEFLARVYGAYMGCFIEHVAYGAGMIRGVDKNGFLMGVFDKNFTPDEDYMVNDKSVKFSDVKLICKPLSEISDEDAEKVIELIGREVETPAARWVNRFFTSFIGHTPMCREELDGFIHSVDYLRSKGYMLPIEGVDLFEAGIAIDKTKTIQP